MSSPLIERLLKEGHARLVTEEGLSEFLSQQPHSLLFFAGDVRRFPESSDLAVILPELVKAFSGAFQVGLVDDAAVAELQKRFGFNHFPSLVLLRGEEYLGTISKLQDWVNYCSELEQLLQSEPRRAPGFTLPVVTQNDSCA